MAESSNTAQKMEKMTLTAEPSFSGKKFYQKYKDADFLKEKNNICIIFGKSEELKKRYDALEPGALLAIDNMFLETGIPVVLKKGKLLDESDVHQDEFTLRRLLGLLAVSVAMSIHITNQSITIGSYRFQDLYITEAEAFGTRVNMVTDHMLYLSAVSGAEYFVDLFGYTPFLFALRRYQLGEITEDQLLHIANIAGVDMIPVSTRCARDLKKSEEIAKLIEFDLMGAVEIAPENIKRIFQKHKARIDKMEV